MSRCFSCKYQNFSQRSNVNLETALRERTKRYNYKHQNGIQCTPLYIKTTNNVNFGTRTYDDLGRRTRGRPKTLCWSQERTMNLKFWSYKCHNFILIQVRMEEAPDFLFFQEKLSTAIVQNIVLAMMKNLYDPTIIYLFNVINRNTRKRYEICRKIRLKKPERRQWLSMEANFSKVSDLKMHSDVA